MTDNAYPKLAAGAPDFPALELEVLNYWTDDDTFRASIERRGTTPLAALTARPLLEAVTGLPVRLY